MTAVRSEKAAAPAAGHVLTKAVMRSAVLLDLPQAELARILGVSPASASRLGRSRFIDPESKEGELALQLVRVYRSLDGLLGGDVQACRKWFHGNNAHLDGIPARLVGSVEGLIRVAGYVDALRGKT